MSLPDITTINDSSSEQKNNHKYRTEIPNILLELLEFGSLCNYSFCLYAVLKRVAGDNGKCTYSIPNLAKKSGFSENTVRKACRALASYVPLIGKPLIRMTETKGPKGEAGTYIITIVPIWEENLQLYKDVAQNKKLSTGSRREPGVVHEMKEGGSPREPKEELFKKNHLKKNASSQNLSSFDSLEEAKLPYPNPSQKNPEEDRIVQLFPKKENHQEEEEIEVIQSLLSLEKEDLQKNENFEKFLLSLEEEWEKSCDIKKPQFEQLPEDVQNKIKTFETPDDEYNLKFNYIKNIPLYKNTGSNIPILEKLTNEQINELILLDNIHFVANLFFERKSEKCVKKYGHIKSEKAFILDKCRRGL